MLTTSATDDSRTLPSQIATVTLEHEWTLLARLWREDPSSRAERIARCAPGVLEE